MILNSNKLSFDQNKLIFKKSRQCSNDFTFIPLHYDNDDILIQTPHCFIPFGVNQFSKISSKKYLDLSFQEKNKTLLSFFQKMYSHVTEKYKGKYHIHKFGHICAGQHDMKRLNPERGLGRLPEDKTYRKFVIDVSEQMKIKNNK